MAENSGCTLDENTRRYYLDAMGIQCWQPLAPAGLQPPVTDRAPASVSGSEAKPADQSAPERSVPEKSVQEKSVPENPVIDQPLPLAQIIAQCESCGLHTARRQALVDRGDRTSDLAFVLLAPQADDETAGELCSGEAGELFRKMLAAIDVGLDSVFITTLLKCPVPSGHTVTPAEVAACRGYLEQQLQVVQPRLVVVLGQSAAQCLLQKGDSLDALREAINPATRNSLQAGQSDSPYSFASMPLLVSYSPHELLMEAQHKRKAWADLQLLQSLMMQG